MVRSGRPCVVGGCRHLRLCCVYRDFHDGSLPHAHTVRSDLTWGGHASFNLYYGLRDSRERWGYCKLGRAGILFLGGGMKVGTLFHSVE